MLTSKIILIILFFVLISRNLFSNLVTFANESWDIDKSSVAAITQLHCKMWLNSSMLKHKNVEHFHKHTYINTHLLLV